MSRRRRGTPLYQLKRRLEEAGQPVEVGPDYTAEPRQLVFRVDGQEVARAETDDDLAQQVEKWLEQREP